jgi:hypothetical protein
MKKLLAISFLLVFALSAFSGTDVNASGGGVFPPLGNDGKPIGTFCIVEKVDVCVIAMTEEDCTKLGGEKADSCSIAEKAEDKN